MRWIVSRLVVVTGAAAVLAVVSIFPVSAAPVEGPVLKVFNPAQGDVLRRGTNVFVGQAFDRTSTTGQGIDRVSVYAGNRDAGAKWLGIAAKATCQSGNCPVVGGREQDRKNFAGGLINLSSPANGWALKIMVTRRKIPNGNLWFYARSSVTGQETVVKVDNIQIDPGKGRR